MMKPILIAACRSRCLLLAALVGIACPTIASTDLAQAPISFLLASPVKPNILFLLDDSGSMQWSYLPDEVLAHQYENAVGYRSSLCNKIYYNPEIRYPAPVRADGTEYPAARFDAARYDGFRTDSVTVNLGTGFMPWRSDRSTPATPAGYPSDCWGSISHCQPVANGLPNQPGPAHYFIYRGDRADRLGDNSADDHCKDTRVDGGSAAGRRWQKVIVGERSGPGGSDERQNFANWFSYHRTRMLTMKTAVGRAFSQLDANGYRVGFSVTSEPGTQASSPGFLQIADFGGEHRRRFYDKLYAVLPVSSTPLRAALAKAGRLYAGKLLSGAEDPVQYSCQRNFTILSTDGYWNTQAESRSFGPVRIDGSTDVGNVDWRLPRPMYDGSRRPRPIRIATLTIEPQRSNQLLYSGTHGITVDGLPILAGYAYIQHADPPDPVADAALLATVIASRITLGGYRAFPEQNRVYILAPPAAGDIGSLPQITSTSSFPLSITPFAAISGGPVGTNTLADVAAYYFETDLRSPALGNCGQPPSLCDDNVPLVPGQRGGPHQHMVTHTLGLGASGTLRYRDDYETAADGDFRRIVTGELDWPDPIFSPGAERIDDLWHAAVNGGGRYFSARSPESLARALFATLSGIRAATASASAAATSSQQPTEGDDLLFGSLYRSLFWDGDLVARRISLVDAGVSPQAVWSAAAQLAARAGPASDTRQVYIAARGTANGLKEFRWSLLDAGERARFSNLCTDGSERRFSHCMQLSEDERRRAGGAELVDYLRGQRQHEDRPENTLRLFRKRDSVLGAPVNAQPLYIGAPGFRYADEHYGEFRERLAAQRPGTVYLAANDGMLHAFDSTTGAERWAFLPQAVLPELWRLADPAWATRFRFLLDGTPVAGDICPRAPDTHCSAEQWRTIVVGGLGAAGRAFYALDVTDPAQPALLWEFSVSDDPDLGYALGKPLITKRRDGRWVVVLTSGYNNLNPGSGRGILFVLDAATGRLLQRIDMGVGSTAAPAGLAQLNVWVDNLLDNTAERLYGGDLLGNLWRFDISEPRAAGEPAAVALAQLVRDGVPQPVTTRPELSVARAGGAMLPLVSVGTGRYLGMSDVQDKSVQTVYTLKDSGGATGLGDVRRLPNIVQQRLLTTGSADTRSVSRLPVDWTSSAGWYLDLDAQPESGERVNIDIEQQIGVLYVVSNIPDRQACRPGSESWVYAFHTLDGSYLPWPTDAGSQRVLATRISRTALVAGARHLRIGNRVVSVITDEAGKVSAMPAAGGAAAARPVRRVSWRELDMQ